MDAQLRQAFRFMLNHAGYSVPPGRAVCALNLARAEAWAREEGVKAEWVPDDQPWDGDTPAPEQIWGCVLTLGDEQVSLWGIGDPSFAYQRVVEAELATELQHGLFASLAAHVRQL